MHNTEDTHQRFYYPPLVTFHYKGYIVACTPDEMQTEIAEIDATESKTTNLLS